MAANVNGEEIFQQLYTVFSSLNEELKRWYIACLQHRRQVESRVQQSRKLLKPWPSKQKEKEKSEQDSISSQRTEDKDTDKDATKPNPDLELLDKILEKAQRAREIQNKLDTVHAASGTRKPNRKGQTTSADQKNTAALSTEKPVTKTNKPEDTTSLNKKTVATTTKAQTTSRLSASKPSVKQPVLLRKNKPTVMKSTYGATYGKLPSSRSGSRSRSTQSAKNAVSGTLNPQPSSQDVKDTCKANVLKEKTSVKSDSTKSVKTEKGSNTSKTKDSTEPSANHKETIENPIPEDSDFVERAQRELNRISADLKDLKSRKQELSKREENKPNLTTHTEKQTNENKMETETELPQVKKPFLLTEDGHTLTLPSTYRKLKSSHYKLISKLMKASGTTDQSSENFLKRLESQFDLNDAPHELVNEKTKSIVQAQKRLELYLQWVVDRSGSEGDSFSWQNVYKFYRHWQVLLGKFRELQKGTQELLAAEEYQQRWCPCGGCITTKEMSSHFLKTNEMNGNEAGKTPACVLYSSWLDPVSSRKEYTQEYRSNTEPVTYRSERELRMLNESLHNLQMTKVDLYIQNHIGKKALDVLERMDVSHRFFPSIYRSLWGLVCCDGKAFPSVVRDGGTE